MFVTETQECAVLLVVPTIRTALRIVAFMGTDGTSSGLWKYRFRKRLFWEAASSRIVGFESEAKMHRQDREGQFWNHKVSMQSLNMQCKADLQCKECTNFTQFTSSLRDQSRLTNPKLGTTKCIRYNVSTNLT